MSRRFEDGSCRNPERLYFNHQELRMGRLSPEQTEALAEAVFDFQTEADLTAWLAALPGDKTSSN